MNPSPDPMNEHEARSTHPSHDGDEHRRRTDWSDRARDDMRRTAVANGSLGMAFLELRGFEEALEGASEASRKKARQDLEDRIHTCIRSDDPVCRWSHDEYVVLFRRTTEDECIEAIRRVKAKIEAPPLHVEGEPASVFATFGVVVVNSHESDHELESLMEMAADSFQRARREGPGALHVSRA